MEELICWWRSLLVYLPARLVWERVYAFGPLMSEKLVVDLAFLAARLSARHVGLCECHDWQWCTWSTKSWPLQMPRIARWNKDQDKGSVCNVYIYIYIYNVKTTGVWTKPRSRTTAAEDGSVIPDRCAGKVAVEHDMDTIDNYWQLLRCVEPLYATLCHSQKKPLFLIPRFSHSFP